MVVYNIVLDDILAIAADDLQYLDVMPHAKKPTNDNKNN